MKIDSAAIKQLAKLLNDTGLTEIEVAEGDSKIRVKKDGLPVYAAAPAPFAGGFSSDGGVPAKAAEPASLEGHPGAVTSPMVGTCYLSPEPGAQPFAKKGDTVKAGDTLCIIEAMKVMNPIKADKGGTVTTVAVRDAQPVEFGDVLFVIE